MIVQVQFGKPKFLVNAVVSVKFKEKEYTDFQGLAITTLREALVNAGLIVNYRQANCPYFELGVEIVLHDVHDREVRCDVQFLPEDEGKPRKLIVSVCMYEWSAQAVMNEIFRQVAERTYEHIAGFYGVITEKSVKQTIDQAVLYHQV